MRQRIRILWLIGLFFSFLIGDIFTSPDKVQDTNGNPYLLFIIPMVFIVFLTIISFISYIKEEQPFSKKYLYLALITFLYCVKEIAVSFWTYIRFREGFVLQRNMANWPNKEELLQTLHEQSILQLQMSNTYLYFNMETYVGLFAGVYLIHYYIYKRSPKE